MNLSKATQLDEAEKLLDQANAILSELWQVEEAAWNERSERWQESENALRFRLARSFPVYMLPELSP
jgi:hypothetical protein